ncbi:cyclic nucleotide-gated ion channel 1-like [Musa acuminata AAA Group]|uniref:cyclic nucleotide-gated ion channel 1-like n=1 Tax=Musa acuminata AAA Group TaxID=214697 RepID=UPI0031CE084F
MLYSKDIPSGSIFKFQFSTNSSAGVSKSKKKVLDPEGPFLQRWNKIFVISCIVAVSVDPLFFYIPVIDGDNNCLYLHKKLEIAASVLRFFTDIFYLVHIVFQFRTGFIAPSSRVFGRGVLVKDLSAIAKRYLSSYFLIDILAVFPLPQILGAFWYFLSIEREGTCWRKACAQPDCKIDSLICGQQNNQKNSFLGVACPISPKNGTIFDLGIYLQALQNVVRSKKFLEKFFYCFWWGLQNLR